VDDLEGLKLAHDGSPRKVTAVGEWLANEALEYLIRCHQVDEAMRVRGHMGKIGRDRVGLAARRRS